jgi:hypothetical protein
MEDHRVKSFPNLQQRGGRTSSSRGNEMGEKLDAQLGQVRQEAVAIDPLATACRYGYSRDVTSRWLL